MTSTKSGPSAKQGPSTKRVPSKKTKPDFFSEAATRKINRGGTLLFVVFTLFLLGFFKADQLFRMQEQSLFLSSWDFMLSFLDQPGKFLSYPGCFLTQFFHYPWLGILLFTGLLLLVQQLTAAVLQVHRGWYFLSFIPSSLLLLLLTQLDYNMYVMNIRDIAYSQLLGYVVALGSLGIYRRFNAVGSKNTFLVLFVLVGYPLAGFYALVGTFYMALYEMLSSPLSRKSRVPRVVVAFVLIAAVPRVYYLLFYSSLNPDYIYTYGVPVMEYFTKGAILWTPLIGCCLVPVLLLLRPLYEKRYQIGNKKRILSNGLILLICLFMVGGFSNRDRNFRNQLKMERAIGDRDWDRVLKVAEKSHQTPTRNLVMYRNIALLRKNQLCEKMFTYPDGVDTLKTSGPIKSSQTNAPLLYYHYGLINYSYRWCMELTVQYGMKVDYLRYMIKIALFNKEIKLAKKYIRVLKKTFFYRGWALEQERYANDLEQFMNDPESKEIADMLAYEEQGWESDMNIEGCIHYHFNHLNSGSLPMLEMAMASILSGKSVDLFWNMLPTYLSFHPQIPTHVQEAVLLYSVGQKRPELSQLPFNPVVLKRFQEFLRQVNSASGKPQGPALKRITKEFGDTFWYYFLFVKAN